MGRVYRVVIAESDPRDLTNWRFSPEVPGVPFGFLAF